MVAEGDEGGEDLRLAFLESWITLKLPSGKDTKGTAFKKLLATEAAAPIQHFLSNPDCRRLFISGKVRALLSAAFNIFSRSRVPSVPHRTRRIRSSCAATSRRRR